MFRISVSVSAPLIPAATPTASPAAGTYTSAQMVTLATTTAGASIYYTTNGTTPSTSSTLYTGTAITISATSTLQAIAVATGYAPSAVLSAAYTINTATVSPNGTTIPSATQIVDSAFNVWTVTGGVVYQNGTTAGYSASVVLLLYYGGNIYQENNSYSWYEWNGTTYVASSDPRATAITVPGQTLSAAATAGNGSAAVSFARPYNSGGGTLTYTVTSNPGGHTATGSASPLTVSGLTNGTAYTFTVTAANSLGSGPASAASNSVTPTSAVTFGISVSGHNILDGTNTPVQLRGVNVSGPEGIADNGPTDIWRGQAPNFAVMKTWGINVVRICLAEANWLGLCSQSLAQGMTAANYQAGVQSAVTAANAQGIYVILDLHIVAVPNLCPAGQNPMADAQYSPTFWTQVANAYKNNPAVMFELFNEPQGNYPPTTADWNNYVNGKLAESTDTNTQTMLNAIRATGATNTVLVDTLNYASTFGNNGNPNLPDNPPGFYLPTDTLNPPQLVAVRHFYNAATQYNPGANVVLNKGIPIIMTEYGDYDGGTSDTTVVYAWADPGGGAAQALASGGSTYPGVSYVAWTWNFGYGGYSLISNSSGTNAGSAYSELVESHYKARAGL